MYIKSIQLYLKVFTITILIIILNYKLSKAETTITTSAKYAILIDYDTGRVLLSKNSNIAMSPASMSKLMTIYLTFEAIKQERISLDTELVVSEKAWRKKDENGKELPPSGSSMFLEPLTKVTVEELIRGIIV